MPEGPELHISTLYINKLCKDTIFSGKVVKSAVSTKNPDIPWDCPAYTIQAASRGKEVKLTLTAIKQENASKCRGDAPQTMNIIVRFGMSGCFKFDPVSEQRKHAHMNFYTSDGESVLSFVDVRRFGRWDVGADWSKDRGPCVIYDYAAFRENVLSHLDNVAFDRPICEVLLNQKYFNGIGNYLRAEILYRLDIPPFARARDVLEPLVTNNQDDRKEVKMESTGQKDHKDVKMESDKSGSDILSLCNQLPLEVVKLGGTAYTLEGDQKDYSAFSAWLRCYYNPDMKNMVDHNKRTIWFSGPAGPLVPKENKSKKRKSKTKLNKEDVKNENEEYNSDESNKRRKSNSHSDSNIKDEKPQRNRKAARKISETETQSDDSAGKRRSLRVLQKKEEEKNVQSLKSEVNSRTVAGVSKKENKVKGSRNSTSKVTQKSKSRRSSATASGRSKGANKKSGPNDQVIKQAQNVTTKTVKRSRNTKK